MSYQDKTLTCAECGQPFTFSADDQAYHAQKGYTNEPKRCTTCRQSRRDQRYSGSGSGSYSSGSGSGGYTSGYRREMYSVVCAQCGKEAQVPFQPRGDRPVYCQDCYDKQGGRAARRY
jgi:CxxC-x17-CxxC domain-containing protein